MKAIFRGLETLLPTLAACLLLLPAVSDAAPGSGDARAIPDRYIVIFKSQVDDPAIEANNLVLGARGDLHFTYTHAVKGFAATLSQQAVSALAHNPNVAYIEQDQTVTLQTAQTSATWGIDRIDQIALPLNTTYEYQSTGSAVYAFVIDTGIRATHSEFFDTSASYPASRVMVGLGFDAIGDGKGTADCNGHGTHVAGTIGGTVSGVAKGALLVPVRVLDCAGSGTVSGVVAGVDYVVSQADLGPAVANMSLGGGASKVLDAAVAKTVDKGVIVVVAAGNSSNDACRYSPARAPKAITVGATTKADARATYSNYGSCLDVFAPGSSITSAWNTSDSATNTISGTSMASPHAAGVAVRLLETHPGYTPALVADLIVAAATLGKVTSPGRNSPNRLLYIAPGE